MPVKAPTAFALNFKYPHFFMSKNAILCYWHCTLL